MIDLTPPEQREWYERHGCDHAHCPDGCEHPQPLMADGELYCGRCWFKFGELTRMEPCGPDNCD